MLYASRKASSFLQWFSAKLEQFLPIGPCPTPSGWGKNSNFMLYAKRKAFRESLRGFALRAKLDLRPSALNLENFI